MNSYFLVAAILSAGVLAAHVVGGGRFYVRPLLAARDLHPVPKHVHYYCWHLVTMVLAAMAAGFGQAAVEPGARDVAVLLTLLAAGFTLWSLALVTWKRQPFLRMPQWALLGPVAVAGGLGLLAGGPA